MRIQPAGYVWGLMGLSLAVGIADGLLARDLNLLGVLAFPHGVANAVLLFAWCKAHARSAGIAEPTGAATLCGLLWPLGVPLYFVRAFGFRRGTRGILKALGVMVVAVLAYDGGHALAR